jgi:hypothetical protein
VLNQFSIGTTSFLPYLIGHSLSIIETFEIVDYLVQIMQKIYHFNEDFQKHICDACMFIHNITVLPTAISSSTYSSLTQVSLQQRLV